MRMHSCQQLTPLPLSLDTARRLSLLSTFSARQLLSAMTNLQSLPVLKSMLMKQQWQNFEIFVW